MSIVTDIALVFVALFLAGLLTAIKTGFSEVIKALEAIHGELAKRTAP